MNATSIVSRSTFVTVLGSILLAVGALTLFTAISRAIGLEVAAPIASTPDAPPAGEFLLGMFRGINVLNIAIGGLFAYAAYAFLKRRNWARKTFVVLFAIIAAGNVLTLLLFGLGFGFAGLALSQASASLTGETGAAFTWMLLFVAAWAIGIAILFVWLIKRLRSPAVKAEFGAAGSVA